MLVTEGFKAVVDDPTESVYICRCLYMFAEIGEAENLAGHN